MHKIIEQKEDVNEGEGHEEAGFEESHVVEVAT